MLVDSQSKAPTTPKSSKYALKRWYVVHRPVLAGCLGGGISPLKKTLVVPVCSAVACIKGIIH